MWIGGRDAVHREHVRRLARRLWLNAFASALMAVSTLVGLTPAWASGVTMVYSWVGLLVFYGLLRSGYSQRWADPSLTFTQLVFAISSVVVSYGLVDIARGAALQLLCLLLAFEMDRLSPRQLLRASLFAIGMLGLTALWRVLFVPVPGQLAVELYDLLMAAVLLPAAIWVGSEVGRLYSRLMQQREQLALTLDQLNELSGRDALTGLTNRRQMMSLLEQEHRRQQRAGQHFCIAILDIDWFKQVNDRHGHGVGDQVLRQFAAVAAGALPAADTLARWGGEEFLLLMPARDQAQGMALLETVKQAIARHDWAALATDLRISFSAGLALWDGSAAPDTLLECADAALYSAKHLGRDRCVASAPNEPPAVPPAAPAVPPTAAPVWFEQTHFRKSGAAGQVTPLAPLQRLQPQPVPRAPRRIRPSPTVLPGAAPPTGWLRLCADLLMSTDPAIREHLRLPLIAYVLHVIWIMAVQWYAVPAGHLGALQAQAIMVVNLVVVFGSYLLIRSGATRRLNDPGLVLVQMICACAVAGYGYAVAPLLRPSLLHLLCVIQVFGMVTLRPQAARAAGVAAVLVLLAVLTSLLVTQEDGNLAEMLKLALACFVVGRLAVLSHQYSQVREKVAAEQQQLVEAVAQVQELVIRDALTGLFNRKHMQDLLVQERERFSRTGLRFCVALIDVDHFKRVNDTYGHQTGDEVLVGVARAAQQALRDSDVICRWGGEEFLVLMRDTEPAFQGLMAMSRLRRLVDELQPPEHAPDLTITFSAGLTTPLPDETLEQTLARADRALYAAKASGRNRDMVAVGDDIVVQALPQPRSTAAAPTSALPC